MDVAVMNRYPVVALSCVLLVLITLFAAFAAGPATARIAPAAPLVAVDYESSVPSASLRARLPGQTVTVTVTGTVADAGGQPPPTAAIVAMEPVSYTLVAYTPADASGHYTLTVPAEATYWLLAVPFSGAQVGGYGLHGLFPRGDMVTVGSAPLEHHFILDPCYELVLEGYDADGNPLTGSGHRLVPNAETFALLSPGLTGLKFTAALTDSVARGVFSEVQRGSEPPVPSVCLPPGEPRRLFLLWTVPGFGRVVLGADNGGGGFQGPAGPPYPPKACPEQGRRVGGSGGAVLNLNYELARTQVARLRANYDRYLAAGYTISPTITARLAQAESELTEAAARTGADRAAWADQALNTSLWALEDLELARAGQDIARYRQGNLTITVVDAAGLPLPGATVAYTQTAHDFLFGVFDSLQSAGEDAYRLMQAAGVNYVTSGFYWIDIEPQEGQIRWDYLDHDVGVLDLAAMGFRQKAHPLIWLMDMAMPDYLKAKSFPELDAAVDTHVRTLADRYGEQVSIWEVINEAHAAWASGGFPRQDVTALTRTGERAIRETDPAGRISVNAAFDWFGESKSYTYLLGPEDTFSIPVWDYFDRLVAEGVDFDIVGQQLYNGGASFLFQQYGLGPPLYFPTWDLTHLSAVMDRLQIYGKPVHLTEQSVAGTWDDAWTSGGWWHSPWDPATQAEFLTAYYTIGFSKPRNEAMTWWGVTDRGAFILKGGLLDENNTPKLAYYALRDFIARHTTTGVGATDAAGQLSLRVYGGDYQVAVTLPGQAYGPVTATATIHVTEQQDNRSTVTLDPSRAGLVSPPWPTFGHDPQHTSRSAYNGPHNPVRLWAYAVPGGRAMNFAPSVDADGTVYVGTWGDISEGNAPGKLYALRPDGSLKWLFDPGPPEQPSQGQHPVWGTVEASVAIAPDGTLYFGRGDNKLYALYPDGALKWIFRTFPQGYPEQGGQIISSPTIGPDGTVYFGTVPYTDAGVSALFAVNPDGSEKWRIQMGTEGVWASPALGADGTVYVGAWDGNFYAIEDRGRGDYRVRWTYRPPGSFVNWFGPASIGPDGTVYAPAVEVTGICSAVGKLYALTDASTTPSTARPPDPPTLRPCSGQALGGTGGGLRLRACHFGYAQCRPECSEGAGLSTSLGEAFQEKWAFAAPGPDEVGFNLSIAADGTIYAGAASLNNHQSPCNKPDRGNLYALTDNGPGLPPTVRWIYPAGGGVSGTAIGADGTVYVAVRGDTSTQLSAGLKAGVPGRVEALDPEDGSPLWPAPYQAAGEIWWGTPALGAGGALYFADAPCADIINIFPCHKAPALYALGDVADDDFLFGIGYTTGGLAATYADTGVRQAKPGYDTSWAKIEPDPPENGIHTYHWDDLDKVVAEYQSYGYSEMHITLESKSSWGTLRGCEALRCKPSLPKPEHWADYEDYVRAVVERYDGDGADDMAGLRYPVRQYEIETEADAWWEPSCSEAPQDPDRASTYLQLLGAAQRVARQAYAEVQVFPGAMYFYGLFSGDPDEATIAARRAENATVDCLVAFNEDVLRHPELFDAVEFHFLSDDYRELEAILRWLRGQMEANGYQKPLYPSDAVSGPTLVPMSFWETLYPQDIVKGYLDVIHDNIMTDTVSQEYLDIRAWYAGEQAEFTVKLLLTAMAQGVAGLQLGALTDFPWLFCLPTWYPNAYAVWNWGILGMAEMDWGPFFLCFPLGYEPGQPRPVFHTLRWLITRLQGFRSVERLSPAVETGRQEDEETREKRGLGQSSVGVYAYQVMVEGRPIYVLWAEDGVGQVMEESEPRMTVILPVATAAVTVTHTITGLALSRVEGTGQTDPVVEVLPAVGGAVRLTVTETPLFVEGDTAPCPMAADFDCDGEVTVADIMTVAAHWGTRLGDPDYAADFDLDRDGDTDVLDVMRVARRWDT